LKIQTTIFTRRNASNPQDISTLDVPLTSVFLSDPSAPSDPPDPSDSGVIVTNLPVSLGLRLALHGVIEPIVRISDSPEQSFVVYSKSFIEPSEIVIMLDVVVLR